MVVASSQSMISYVLRGISRTAILYVSLLPTNSRCQITSHACVHRSRYNPTRKVCEYFAVGVRLQAIRVCIEVGITPHAWSVSISQ